jgi:hypothetical protein
MADPFEMDHNRVRDFIDLEDSIAVDWHHGTPCGIDDCTWL